MTLYAVSDDNRFRYVLGEVEESSKNPLICFGINPSIATPEKYDCTISTVRNKAYNLGYDGWIMLNVYPQRATNPQDLSNQKNEDEHKKNINEILCIINKYPNAKIWAAWGKVINKRLYLIDCLKDIHSSLKNMNINWLKAEGFAYPHHPTRLSSKVLLIEFDIEAFLK